MAKNTFLNEQEFLIAQGVLRSPVTSPRGNLRTRRHLSNEPFSRWLELRLDKKLRQHPLWEESAPIALGSYARGELCPNSDVDLLFVGREEAVSQVVDNLNEQGLKIRYRMPEDIQDWTQGVGMHDIIALLSARPLEPLAARSLFEQQEKIWSREKSFIKSLVKAMGVERKERRLRYDSIDNFLEPNLKYGYGGLRDIQQALMTYELAQEKFPQIYHALEVLRYYQAFFLTIRQRLHLMEKVDILMAQDQRELSDWFQYEEPRDFMREVQKGLSRVSFYTDWITQSALASQNKLETYTQKDLTSLQWCFEYLEEDYSILMQNRIRHFLPTLGEKVTGRKLGKILKKAMGVYHKDRYIVALFRSHLMQYCFPDIKRLTGWVQHDQYHRFTADTHIMQAMREVRRVYKSPKKSMGLLREFSLSKDDWEILMWTALYHDIAKGLEGDHAIVGEKIVKRDFKKFGFPDKLANEVCWLVKNHLLLSKAAFRQNPESPQTWQELSAKGVKGKRLIRLGVFTLIDIRATNPDAWNSWKERLLYDLMKTMEENATRKAVSLRQLANKKQVEVEPIFAMIDKTVLSEISVDILLQDSLDLEKYARVKSLPPLVVRVKQNDIWIRLHSHTEANEVLADFVTKLYVSGCNISHACINSDGKYGVYDWFRVKTGKSPEQLEKILRLKTSGLNKLGQIFFDRITITHRDKNEVIISFRGKDQQGLLVAAVNALFSWKLEVKWARAHTWGNQIEDIFSVAPHPKIDKIIEGLEKKFCP